GAADRHHQAHAQDQADDDQCQQEQFSVQRVAVHQVDAARQQDGEAQFDDGLVQFHLLGVAHLAHELAHGHEAAGEGYGAGQDAEDERDAPVQGGNEVDQVFQFLGFQVAGCRHHQGRATAKAVECRDHFRHLGHLHALGHHHADRGTNCQAQGNVAVADDIVVRQRGNYRDQHTQGRQLIAAHRCFGQRHAFNTVDKQYGGNQITKVDQSLHRKGPSRLFLFEHVQHAIGHHEATDDVDGGQDDRNDTQYRGQPAGVLAATGTDDGADHDNPGDGVGAAHQRGVQGGGYLVDDFDADEDRQYEDR